MYNLIEYSDSCSEISGILFQHCRDVPAVNTYGAVNDFTEAIATTDSFSPTLKCTGQTDNNATKNVEIMVPLKYISNFWRTLEIALIICELILDLNWSENCVIVATNVAAQATTFSITDAKYYVPVVTLSTEDNAKLLERLKSGFNRTINWNKFQTKVSTERQNQCLGSSIDPKFHGLNRLFVFPFKDEAQRTSYWRYYLPTKEIKNYNVMIDRKKLFWSTNKKYLINIIDNIRKISTGQGDDHTIGFLLDNNYFRSYYKVIAIDLGRQQALDVDPKAIKKINFTGKSGRPINNIFHYWKS